MKKIVSITLGILLLFVLTGCGFLNQEEREDMPPQQQEEINDHQPSEEEEIEEEVLEDTETIIGEEAPYFSLENEKGEIVEVEQSIEKPVVMTFWVDWEEASKEQLTIVENVERLLGEDVVFLGVHGSAFDVLSQEEIEAYVEEQQFSFEILLDKEGEVVEQYQVGRFPTMVFLDQEGRVVQAYTTLIEEDEILEVMQEILK